MITNQNSVEQLIQAALEAPRNARTPLREKVLAIGRSALPKLKVALNHEDARVRVIARAWVGWLKTPEDYAAIDRSFDVPSDSWVANVSNKPPSRESVASGLMWPPTEVSGLIGEILMNRGDRLERYQLEGCIAALGQLHQETPSEVVEDIFLSLSDQPTSNPVRQLLLHELATNAPPNRERLRILAGRAIPPRQALAISLMLEAIPDAYDNPFPDSGGR